MNFIKTQRRNHRKKRDKFIANNEFKTANELPFTAEDIADAIELKRIIYVEFGGKKRFPTFQFNANDQVYPVLQAHLPRLLNSGRSGWDICFWLFTEFGVVIKTVRTDARQLKDISLDDVLRIGAIAGRLKEVRTAMPIDLVTTNDKETFAAFIEQLLNPEYRKIPEKTVNWDNHLDIQSRTNDDISKS